MMQQPKEHGSPKQVTFATQGRLSYPSILPHHDREKQTNYLQDRGGRSVWGGDPIAAETAVNFTIMPVCSVLGGTVV